jgi:hypothetical protein
MLFCDRCKVTVAGNQSKCPLCQGKITGPDIPDENVFPVIRPVLEPFKTLIAFIGFATISAAVVSVTVNIAVGTDDGWWSVFVVAGLGSLWLAFSVSNNRWWNIPKNIFFQLALVSVLAILWDFFTGYNKWSLNFVIPILFSCSMVALSVLAKIRHLNAGDYLMYLVIISVISIFSLLLIVFKVVTIPLPALICFAFSVISIARIMLFEGRSLLEELHRRMHL